MSESDILKEKQKENAQKSNLSSEFLAHNKEAKPEPLQEKNSIKTDEAIQLLEKTISELKDKNIHLHADMENLRKRHSKEIESTAQFASSSLLKDLVEPFEQLFMAISSIGGNTDDKSKPILDGIEITKKAFEKAFVKHGLVRIFPQGEKFDHETQQAVSQIKQEGVESGIVINVIQAGYILNGRTIKPAMVIVAL